jgi:hypothetical protein
MSWRAITGKEDFRNLTVFRWANTPVYKIDFTHRERLKRKWHLIFMVVTWGLAILLYALDLMIGPLGYLIPLAMISGFVVLIVESKQTGWVQRSIIVDAVKGKLSIWRNGKKEIERPISANMHLTVDDHPEAEIHRQERMEKKRGQKLSIQEQSHVLTGWFGARGSERVILMSQVEWPCAYSLQEVQQAIIWALERAASDMTAESTHAQEGAPPSGGMSPAQTINPPLD